MRQCNVNQTCVYLYAYTFRYKRTSFIFVCVYILSRMGKMASYRALLTISKACL